MKEGQRKKEKEEERKKETKKKKGRKGVRKEGRVFAMELQALCAVFISTFSEFKKKLFFGLIIKYSLRLFINCLGSHFFDL